MVYKILPTEAVGLVVGTRMNCCSSRSLVGDGWVGRVGSGLVPLEYASLRNLDFRQVNCVQRNAVSGRQIFRWSKLWRRHGHFGFDDITAGDFKQSSRCSQVRASEDAECDPLGDDELGPDPLGPGYWDGAEGKQQMQEIEDMKELIAEAERLRKESQAEGAPDDEEGRKERARRDVKKLQEELAKRAAEQAEQRKAAEKMYQLGQTAYARGMYDKSVELFEAALTNIQGTTNLGGEIQIWLAMAYDANDRHADCIALYRRLEARHPSKQIKRQAADLRYILEAPKLKISREEMVSIPLIEREFDRKEKTYSQKLRQRMRPKPKLPKEKDYMEDLLGWDPPRWERNPYFWVALTVWLTLVGISLMFQD